MTQYFRICRPKGVEGFGTSLPQAQPAERGNQQESAQRKPGAWEWGVGSGPLRTGRGARTPGGRQASQGADLPGQCRSRGNSSCGSLQLPASGPHPGPATWRDDTAQLPCLLAPGLQGDSPPHTPSPPNSNLCLRHRPWGVGVSEQSVPPWPPWACVSLLQPGSHSLPQPKRSLWGPGEPAESAVGQGAFIFTPGSFLTQSMLSADPCKVHVRVKTRLKTESKHTYMHGPGSSHPERYQS